MINCRIRNFLRKLKLSALGIGCGVPAFLSAAEYVTPLEKIDDWMWGGERPALRFPAMIGKPALKTSLWEGEKDLSARVSGMWTHEGLVFFVDVTDDTVSDPLPEDSLWLGDALEFFIISSTDQNYAVGNRLQIIVSAPDKNNVCRSAFYADAPELARKYVKISGQRTADGYSVTMFLPWEALGKDAEKMIMSDGFRFNMFIDDRDKSSLSLNGRPDISRTKEAGGLFRPVSELLPGEVYDLSMTSDISTQASVLDRNQPFELDVKRACKIILRDQHGKVIIKKEFADGKISFSIPFAGLAEIQIFFVDSGCDFLQATRSIAVIDFALLQQKLVAPGNPGERIIALGVLNAIECIRSASDTDNDPEELAWRLKQLAGSDISHAPGILRFLNLMGDPAGLVQIGIVRGKNVDFFSQCENKRAVFTAQWGGVPIVYADILLYKDAETARKAVYSNSSLRREIPLSIPGADAVYAGHGLTFSGGLLSDDDPEHLVLVIDPAAPGHLFRLTPELAVKYAGAAGFTPRQGANPEHIEFMKKAGLRELTESEAAAVGKPVIYLGREGAEYKGLSRCHAKNGIADDTVWAAKGNVVIRTSCTVPELAREVISAVFSGKPVSRKTIDFWRKMRLTSLGGDLPELRDDAYLVRTGDVHTHTFYSDGSSTPGTLLAEAVAGGMDFLLITDHDTVMGAVKLKKVMAESGLVFPLTAGAEITANLAYHLNIFPLQEKFNRGKMGYEQIIAAARKSGAVVMLNHPMRYGTNLRHFWYGSLQSSGIDIVERDLGQRENWKKQGCEAAFMGSTDTHMGVFGHSERTVLLMDEVTDAGIVNAVLQKKCAMIAPDLPLLVYGDDAVIKAVRAALGSDDLPEYHSRRLQKVFANFNLSCFIHHSPVGEGSDVGTEWAGDPAAEIPAIPERENPLAN
ncbi:MAG: hypothetical protein E7050_08150 [Lentisphaerae bacterium]|nr:hypothetical protein [Lentisphaerota bacterium]